jgi:serine beta-lactamase-like protein LACTB, mitochondrial
MHACVLPRSLVAPLAIELLSAIIAFGGMAVGQLDNAANSTAEIDRIAQQEMQKQQIPAMTIAVALDGRVIYSKGFGIADEENAVAANAETLIRTGSLAKPLTSVAAMTLVEAGKLDLDVPIQKYCSAFPQKPWPITMREVLAHTSGIRHYQGNEANTLKHYKSMSDGFVIFAADPLLFKPGTEFNYSTYGYTLAGCVIEGAAGEKYYDYVREHVLAPSGMTHTFVDDVYSIVPHRARGYRLQDGVLQNAEPLDSSYKIPGGGFVSTAEDFVRFGVALMDGRLLKQESLSAIWTASGVPQHDDGQPAMYGMGFGVQKIDGQVAVAVTGGQQGTSTVMEFIPSQRFAVVAFSNMESANLAEITRHILDLFHMSNPHTGN